MAPPGGTGDSGSPAGREGDFDKLLISGNFSEKNRRDYPMTTCVGWINLRERQVSMWEYDFRANQSKPHDTLVEIRDGLAILYKKMDRLCEGRDCYLAMTLSAVPTAVQGYYGEFLNAYDDIGSILLQYIAWAKHYETKYGKGEVPDPEPPDIRKKLFANFALLKKALQCLAEKLEDPAVQPANPGQDTPDGPDRRTA